MSGLRKRSAVWNHFEEVEPKKAKCLYCANILSVPAGNCGNLGRHLKNKHPTVPLVTDRQRTQQTPEAPQETLAPTSTATESGTSDAPAPGSSSVRLLPPHQPSIRDYAHSTKSMPPRRAELLDEQLVRLIANGYYPLLWWRTKNLKKLYIC